MVHTDGRSPDPIALHQTILVPQQGIPPVYIVTVPKKEWSSVDRPLTDIVSDLTGFFIPPISNQEWSGLSSSSVMMMAPCTWPRGRSGRYRLLHP